MCVSVLLVVKCWIINTGPGRTVCLSDYVGEDIAFPAIVLRSKFLLPIILSLSVTLSLYLPLEFSKYDLLLWTVAVCVNICMGWPVCERGNLSFSRILTESAAEECLRNLPSISSEFVLPLVCLFIKYFGELWFCLQFKIYYAHHPENISRFCVDRFVIYLHYRSKVWDG